MTSARLVRGPAHSDLSNVSADWGGLHFEGRPHDGAPRFDEAVFELTGPNGTVEVGVTIEVVPLSENSAPICEGDRVSKRSDGSGPVDVFMHPWCRDPDGDDFTMEGGPPGVHPYSPKHVPAGESESNWSYRTATHSGDEVATIWATDVLGARSQDAFLSVTVGPGVDRLPDCRPNPSEGYNGMYEIGTRAGKTRRLGFICTDPDGDPFSAGVSSPPERGEMVFLDIAPPSISSYWGAERWVDAVYQPADESYEPDRFAVTASGERGDGPAVTMLMVPRPESENHGGGCGWSHAEAFGPVPVVLSANCSDMEGDELSAEIVTQPRHGVVTPPVVTPSRYGSDDIKIGYEPKPGYEGYDCIEVLISDGHGMVMKLAFDIWVRPPRRELPPVELPTLPPLPPLPIGVPPPGTIMSPAQIRDHAEWILGTPAVKRVQTVGPAQVWARSKLSRKELMKKGQAPSLVVICTADCRVRSDSQLATGLRKLRATRRKTVATLRAGQPHLLALTLTPTERRSLRRARKPVAKFKLAIRAGNAPASSVRRSIPVRG